MSDTETETQDFSLADLAGLDVSDIEEIRSSTTPEGVFNFKINSAKLEEGTNRDEERRIILTVTMEITEVKALIDRKIEKESVVGKTYTEKFYIVPEKAPEGIGRIRAFITDVGLDSSGPLGGVEGQAEGSIDRLVGHFFDGKIKHKADANDKSVKYARLVLDSGRK